MNTTAPVRTEWPLSDAQRAVWLDLRLGADPRAYLVAARLRIEGPFDTDTARQAVSMVLGRHDALRLRVDAERPVQRLAPAGSPPFRVHAAPGEGATAEAVETLAATLAQTPLPLGDEALVAVDIVPAGADQWELIWRCHHLVADTAGLALAMRDWARSVDLLSADVAADLSPGTSFIATLANDQTYATSPQAQIDLAHWRRRFEALPEPLLTGPPREVSPHADPSTTVQAWSLDGSEHAAWRAACAATGVTEQRALAALFALTMGTRHDREDLCLGLALHRRHPQTARVVGMFAAALPVRCTWRLDDTLQTAVQRLADDMESDYRHQRAPMDAIARALGLGAQGRARLFDASLSFAALDDAPIRALGRGARVIPSRVVPAAIVPLPLLVTEHLGVGRLSFLLGADPAFVSPAEAASVARALRRTMAAFCADPHLPGTALQAVADDEAAHLAAFNPPPLAVPALSLHDHVWQRVQQTPDAVAVIDGDGVIPYGELWQRSGELAGRIAAAVSGAEPVVGVALPRSADTVIALLAILRAGAVYLPLDIAYPAERLQFLLDDAKAALLIDGPETASLRCARLSSDVQAPLPVVTSPEQLAYLIYTSGSTGLPKPVGVPHRAAVNLAFARAAAHDPIGPGDRILAAISVGFDVSIGQLLLPLLSGATIVIAPPLAQMPADAFWALLARHGVTHINSVPSFFDTVSQALEAMPAEQRYTGLKRLMLGGEALTGTLARKLQQRLPGTQIVNMYGPTEACIDATAYVVPAEGELPAALPIGIPLPNYRAHVLDRLGRHVPIGVPGELCMAGAGLARGYIGRPGATAQKFVADPFGEPGERLYRTGDIARWRDDGQIEFLGRRDEQVKIRGFRVETGEIQATLLQHAGTAQAAVIAVKDVQGQNRLIAYIVPQPGTSADAETLRPWLAQRLPEHMLPQAFVTLEALPITPNGKLDRKALPMPDLAAQARTAYEAPQGEAETAIAAVWQPLLGAARIGRHDSFFALGGHSLLAIACADQLQRQGWHVAVSALFEQPDLAALARVAVRLDAGGPALQAVTDASGAPLNDPDRPRGLQIDPAVLTAVSRASEQFARIAATVPGGSDQVQDVYPLTPQQAGLLFHHVMQRHGDPYASPMILALPDAEALDRLMAALQQVIQRHDILRTAILWDGLPEPVQVVWREAPLALEDRDAPTDGDAVSALQALLDVRHHRLDLSRAPMMRALAMPDPMQGRWLLGLVVHHLALDHLSVQLLTSEVSAITQGQTDELAKPVPFREAVWRSLSPRDTAAHEVYFSRVLGDVETPTTPFGLSAAASETTPVAEARLQLPATLCTALRERARSCGVTLASLAHLAWALVLARCSDRDDVVFGTVLSGRMAPGARHTLGLLINTLPLRLNLGATSIETALRATQTALAELMRHEQAPLALAQRCSGIAAPAPLFTALFNFRQSPPLDADPGFELLWSQERTGYPLALAMDDHGESLSIAVQSVAPADPVRVARLMTTALQALTGPLGLPCTRIDLLDADDVAELAVFNPPPLAVPAQSLHDHVWQRVQRAPDAVAVIDGDREIRYGALWERSGALAGRIAAAVSGAEPVVGVALPRSADTVIALLAILRAGAVYLPLDIAYPAERLQFLLDDAKAALLIDGPETASLRCARLSSDVQAPLPVVTSPEQLAYLIYTSGSTGLPKPVGVPHRAAVNLALARAAAHDPIDPGDRILAAISVGFDVSIGQLLLPLLSGATIVIAPPLAQMPADAFWALLARHGVTHINSVPSFFDTVSQALEAMPAEQRYTGLKRLMLGGEALTGTLARKLQQRLPGTQIVNMYGPTEACIDATAYVVPAEGDLPAALPIGTPLPNYRAHVLDRLGWPVPIGVPGELCLAGAGLARGYIGRPGATAQKFVADPFGEPGDRLYRTGDIARWRDDGQIEFLGRRDEQVKIRGFRVETGEVQATLLQHPDVAQAAVIAVKDAQGQNRLIAYIVPQPGTSADAETLRPWLAQRLPEHMLPQAFVTLEALPITPNGKLDRKALPMPVAQARDGEAPNGAAEQAIAALWREMFSVEQVFRDDSFFDLGGQSLLAIGFVERLRQAGWSIDVPTLLARPTLRALAEACATPSNAAVSAPPTTIPAGAERIEPRMLPLADLTQDQIDSIVAAVPGGSAQIQDIYPLAPLQEGMLYHHLLQTEGDVFLTPFIAGFAERADLDSFVAALRQVIARHDILRTSLAWEGLAAPVQVVWRNAPLALEEAAAPVGREALAALQAIMDPATHRMDLQRAPLIRAWAMPDAKNSRWLLGLALHHLVLDHHSMAVVLQEVAQLRAGQGAALPAPVPFRDTVWQTRQDSSTAAHETFFRAMLADVDETTAPFGLAALSAEAEPVAESRLSLPAPLCAALRQRARDQGVTLASLAHLAWALVLARCSDRDDVVFGSVLMGRLAQGSGQALGMLINTLPLRLRLGGATLADALHDTHATLTELMRHEQAPLALAQRCSGVAAPAPLFTALFNFRHSPAASPGDLGFELLWGQERTGYPLALAMDDQGEALSLTVQSVAPADPARVARLMVAALRALTGALHERCDATVLADAHDTQALAGFHAPALSVPACALHEAIVDRVCMAPDAVAVIDGNQGLTYGDLWQRSGELAGRIAAAVSGAEPVVGVALPRSADTVIALLAILRAGAVYLPLDIAYPAERLQFLLDDAKAALLIDGPETASLRCARLSSDVQAPLPVVTSAEQLAYLIYTSGSTGLPKPVGVPHRAAVNLALARAAAHDPIGPGDRILAAISVGFDVSIGQLLLPLLSGATIVIAPPLAQMPADAFWALLARNGVTHINSVPSFFDTVSQALEAMPAEQRYTGLKRLMLGGEALTSTLARKLQQRLPGTQIVNMYGPTEACIDATAYVVPTEGELPAALPIGIPLPNYRAHVLDRLGRHVPIGVPGELCLAGAGLARGYIGRPGATAQKFVADPFGEPGDRLYRTGDIARWRDDGQIEFLGRRDEQVKIRGFRVETGEVQATLLQHAGIAQAAVIAVKDAQGQNRLIAYIVPQPGASADAETLRPWLAQRLPEHMLPQAFVTLEALPITPNGKLDRKALPMPDLAAQARTAYQAPRDALETALQAAWQQVLGVDRIGRDDDFFALGGQSLLAIRLIDACQRAAREAGVADAALRLKLRELMAQPTFGAMADRLRGAPAAPAAVSVDIPIDIDNNQPLAREAQRSERQGALVQPPLATGLLVPLRAAGTRTPVFLVHPQSGSVWCFAHLARALPLDVPVWGLQARGLEPGETPAASIDEMAAEYLRAMRQVQAEGPYQILGYSSGGVTAQAIAVQLRQAGETVQMLALVDAPLPDGQPAPEPTDADVLADAGQLFGIDDPAQRPQDADALSQMMVSRGLAPMDFDTAAAQRLIRTARAIARATLRHRPVRAQLPLVQIHALRRETRSPDWSVTLPDGPVARHLIDTDHTGLVGPVAAPLVARLLVRHLHGTA